MIRALTMPLDGLLVRVYRNLQNGLWSVQYRGKVVGHVADVSLRQVRFHVSEAGRQRVLRQRCKNVHAYAEGIFTRVPQLATELVRYDPYQAPTFRRVADWSAIHSAAAVRLVDGRAYADL